MAHPMKSPMRMNSSSLKLDQIEERPTVTGPPTISDLSKYKMQSQSYVKPLGGKNGVGTSRHSILGDTSSKL